MKNQSRAYLFALITVLLWSTVATAFKIALIDLNNVQLLLIANFASLLIFLMFLVAQGKLAWLKTTSCKDLAFSALQGFLNPFAYYIILFKVYTLLPAQVAQPTNFVWPVVLMLLSVPLLKQSLHLTGILALIISFSGVFILATQGNITSLEIKEPFGIVLSLLTSIIWSLFWILNLKDKRDDVLKLFLSFGFSFIYVFIAAAFTGNLSEITSKPFLPAIYIGFAEMGFAFILWLKALQFSESTGKIANLIYLTPFLSLIVIHFVLGERLYFTSVIGLILIIGGILTGQIKNKAPNT